MLLIAAPAIVWAFLLLFLGLMALTAVAGIVLSRRFPEVCRAHFGSDRWDAALAGWHGPQMLGFLDAGLCRATGSTRFMRLCGALRTGWYVALGGFWPVMALVGFSVLPPA